MLESISDNVDRNQEQEEKEEAASRLETEIDLLHAMYPEQITYDRDERKITFTPSADSDSTNHTPNSSSLLTLRLPTTYPVTGFPTLSKATDHNGKDITSTIAQKFLALSLPQGLETLDELIATFTVHLQTTSTATTSNPPTPPTATTKTDQDHTKSQPRTVIIWLHHLLATSKRKQALTPPSHSVTGITKPGSPGVLIYSGPSAAVHEHVAELKALNWQAFQVRYDEVQEAAWVFGHGEGVVEVESMSEVVAGVGEGRKGIVMEALRMR